MLLEIEFLPFRRRNSTPGHVLEFVFRNGTELEFAFESGVREASIGECIGVRFRVTEAITELSDLIVIR
jgi:hypothetical protein